MNANLQLIHDCQAAALERIIREYGPIDKRLQSLFLDAAVAASKVAVDLHLEEACWKFRRRLNACMPEGPGPNRR